MPRIRRDGLSEEIIDRDALQRLLEVIGGDPADLLELVEDFETTTPGLFREMQEAASAGDLHGLRVSVHSLKSNGRDFGATRLADLCAALEKDCRDGAVPDAGDRAAAIGLELDKARAALSSIVTA